MAVTSLIATESELRTYALGMPGAYEDFPWGERAFKVAKKMFAILNRPESARLSLTVKLAAGHDAALALPFVQPTGYNLGKSGWVTAVFEGRTRPPAGLLCDWIAESYELVAPKRLLRERPG